MPRYHWLGTAMFCLALGCSTEQAENPPSPDAALAADLGVPMDAAPTDAAPPDAAPYGPRTYRLTLDAGAFAPTPEHPSALLYVPSGYAPATPTALVVYIHGFENCVDNIVRPTADGQSCTKEGPVRIASNLIGQLENSGRNALLLCPEVAFDKSSSEPGKLGDANGFHALVKEALAQVQKELGGVSVDKLGPVVLASHSGGYATAAAIAGRGGVPISELYLLDSLYGNSADFESWMKQDLGSFDSASPRRRFASVYTDGGGTLVNNQALATTTLGFIPDKSVLIDDRTTATWQPATYQHGLLFKRSMLSHDGVPQYYFATLLSTSSLPQRHPALWAAATAAAATGEPQ